jgi:hypothetical protein
MMEIANDPKVSDERRDAMLKECASYVCPKPKVQASVEREVPTFTTADKAEAFLAEFISTMAPDLEPAEIATMTRQFIMSKREGEELELKVAAQHGGAEQTITFAPVGPTVQSPDGIGLKDLPGTKLDLSTTAQGPYARSASCKTCQFCKTQGVV